MALPFLHCCEGPSALSCDTLQRCQSTCECTRSGYISAHLGHAAMYSSLPATFARSRIALYCCEGSSALSCRISQRRQSAVRACLSGAMHSSSPATLARSRMALPSLCCEGSSALSCNTIQRCHSKHGGAGCHALQLARPLCALQGCLALLVLLRGLLCAELQGTLRGSACACRDSSAGTVGSMTHAHTHTHTHTHRAQQKAVSATCSAPTSSVEIGAHVDPAHEGAALVAVEVGHRVLASCHCALLLLAGPRVDHAVEQVRAPVARVEGLHSGSGCQRRWPGPGSLSLSLSLSLSFSRAHARTHACMHTHTRTHARTPASHTQLSQLLSHAKGPCLGDER